MGLFSVLRGTWVDQMPVFRNLLVADAFSLAKALELLTCLLALLLFMPEPGPTLSRQRVFFLASWC